ncbi:hypothetical protein BJ742DRAFT_304049 [Cladochytrium replicatum]|nr:hypothetical protein BJ742DRAFT_304049 [Cladochytrium replicatum]
MDRKIPYSRRLRHWSLGNFLPTVYSTFSADLLSEFTKNPSVIYRAMMENPHDPSSIQGLRYNAMGEMIGLAKYFTMQVRTDWTIMKFLMYESDVDYYGYARGEENNGPIDQFLSFLSVLGRSLIGLKVPAIDVGEKIRELSEVRWNAPGNSLPNSVRSSRGTVGRRGQ